MKEIFKKTIISLTAVILVMGLFYVLGLLGEKEESFDKQAFMERHNRLVDVPRREKLTVSAVLASDNLLSDVPEDEFLNHYSHLQEGFGEATMEIEADKPVFGQGSGKAEDIRIEKLVEKANRFTESSYEVSGIKIKTRSRVRAWT